MMIFISIFWLFFLSPEKPASDEEKRDWEPEPSDSSSSSSSEDEREDTARSNSTRQRGREPGWR